MTDRRAHDGSARHVPSTRRWTAAAASALLAVVLAGCVTDPESDPGRAPGRAARSVAVTGDGVTGVHAEVVGWHRTKNNALPPLPAVRALVRFTADDEWTLSGTDVALAVCAVTERAVVVTCDLAATDIDDPTDDPRSHTVEIWLTVGTAARRVHDVVLLPDQYHPAHPPKSADRKDGGTYVAPRFPSPGDPLR